MNYKGIYFFYIFSDLVATTKIYVVYCYIFLPCKVSSISISSKYNKNYSWVVTQYRVLFKKWITNPLITSFDIISLKLIHTWLEVQKAYWKV